MKRPIIYLILVFTAAMQCVAQSAPKTLPLNNPTRPTRVPVAVDAELDEYFHVEVYYTKRDVSRLSDTHSPLGYINRYMYEYKVKLIPKCSMTTADNYAKARPIIEGKVVNKDGDDCSDCTNAHAIYICWLGKLDDEFGYYFYKTITPPNDAVAIKFTVGLEKDNADLIWYDAKGNYERATGPNTMSIQKKSQSAWTETIIADLEYYHIYSTESPEAVTLPTATRSTPLHAVSGIHSRNEFKINSVTLQQLSGKECGDTLDDYNIIINATTAPDLSYNEMPLRNIFVGVASNGRIHMVKHLKIDEAMHTRLQKGRKADRTTDIIINPPFAKAQDIDTIEGLIISIDSSLFMYLVRLYNDGKLKFN